MIMKLVSNHTNLAPSTKFFDSVVTRSITLCGQIMISAISHNMEQYYTHNNYQNSSRGLSHQVCMPIKDLLKHDDPNILQSMKDCMVKNGFVYEDDFVMGLFACDTEDFMILYASFRTVEMAVLFKLIWF